MFRVKSLLIKIHNLKLWKKITAGIFLCLLLWYIFLLPNPLFQAPYSTTIYAENNELLGGKVASDGQWRFRATDSISEKYFTALIQYEDKRFHYHWGVDPIAIARAIVQNIRKKEVVSGGSTLTMQTIRLARGKQRTWSEKIVEIIWATRLEFRHSKDEILRLYASHAPFGGNIVGIDAATWRYFNHSAQELTWAEAATLAVLPNAPAMIHPGKNRTKLLQKRDHLLAKLLQNQKMSEEEYQLAIQEPLPEDPYPLPQQAPQLLNYFFINNSGNNIPTTIHKDYQLQAEEILSQWNEKFSQQGIQNIAAIIIDIQTNEIVAYCGNRSDAQQQHGNQVDIIRAPRSTGSILKPFLYYHALREGEILSHTLLADIPININGFSPQNFNTQYDGAVPASEALARSLNVPAVLLLKKYGVGKFYYDLKKMGLSTLTQNAEHYGLSLILGGAEATLWELSECYSNMGRALLNLPNKEITVVKVEQNSNDTDKAKYEYNKGAVWQTFEILKQVNRPEEIDWQYIPTIQSIAWKTGTSFGFRDAWSIGVTPRFVVGVWVGNASGEGKAGIIGAQTAAPVMFDLFNMLPKSHWFSAPENQYIEAEICHQSGHLRGRFCDKIDTLLILPSGENSAVCPYHNHYFDNVTGETHTIFTLPPAWEKYYKQGVSRLDIYQNFNNLESPMQFIYPTEKISRITLPKQLDGRKGEITLELAHLQPQTTVFWHIDNDFFTQTKDLHKITTHLAVGKHNITVVDQQGNRESIIIYIDR